MELLSQHSRHTEKHAMAKEIERTTLNKESCTEILLEVAREAQFIPVDFPVEMASTER